jgi:hypothetical protein
MSRMTEQKSAAAYDDDDDDNYYHNNNNNNNNRVVGFTTILSKMQVQFIYELDENTS